MTMMTMMTTTTVKFPAHGFRIGSVWDDGAHSHVKRVEIVYNEEYIYSVRIVYIDENGMKVESIHGGHRDHIGSTKREVIDLPSPTQFLISIHGSQTPRRSTLDIIPASSQLPLTYKSKINSLTFQTNYGRTVGPFGNQEAEGIKFSIPLKPAKIVGFHGWSDEKCLTAIGVYVQPITESMRQLQLQLELEPEPEPEPEPDPEPHEDSFSLGEYGREDGECWVESFRAIKRLVIYSNEEWIISIQMEYEDHNEKLVLSKKHGGDGGSKSEVVLEDADEQLVTINGYYDNSLESECCTNMIRSLTVITNNKSYGPFGVEHGTKFSFPRHEQLKVVGIHGRSDSYLNAIGLNVVRTF